MKKVLSALLLAIFAVGMIFAGGSSETAASPSSPQKESNTLTVWAWDPNFNIFALKEAEAVYQKSHPDFKLNIVENTYNDIQTKLVTAAQAGNLSSLPDIFLFQNYAFQNYGGAYPEVFTDLSKDMDFSVFNGTKNESKVDGKQLAVPFDNAAAIFAVRTDILADCGYTADDFNQITWDQFIEQARVVKAKTGLPLITTSGGSEIIIMMLNTAGASPYVNGKLNIANNEVLYRAYSYYKLMIEEGILVDYTDWNEYIASFNTGKAAGLIQGNWIMASIQAATDQSGKWAVLPLPSFGGVDGATYYAASGGSSWVVSGNANKALAIDFLKSTFGSSTELYDNLLAKNSIIGSYTPAASSPLYSQGNPFYGGQAVSADIVKFSGALPAFSYGAYYSEVRSALTDALTNIIQKNADIRTEMKAAEDAVQFDIDSL